jgi:hypothetical protein
MTKTSKLIAGLAVVAGFGVAVLPLASYAETRDVTISVAVDESAGIVSPDSGTPCSNTVTLSGLALGSAAGKGVCSIKVVSNKGYALKLHGSANSNATSLTKSNSTETISSVASTTFSGSAGSSWATGKTLAPTAAEWGFNAMKGSVSDVSGLGSIFTIPDGSGSVTIDTANDATTATTYTFGFAATAPLSQVAGTYVGQVTLTVETN